MELSDGRKGDRTAASDGTQFEYRKLSSNGLWGVWAEVTDSAHSQEFDRAEWQRRKTEKAETERRRRAEAMPATERDRYYQQYFSRLSLNDEDRALLHSKGLPDGQIEIFGAKSLDFGYVYPIRDVAGLIVGAQIRLREATDKGRYRWQNTPRGKQLPDTGELPLAVFPAAIPGNVAALVEGTGTKPFILNQRLGLLTIGAAGGLFPASAETLRATLQRCQVTRVRFYPDAGCIVNKGSVMSQYEQVFDLLTEWGYSVEVAWWGQGYDKHQPDIDEMADHSQIRYLSVQQFLQLAAEAREEQRRADGCITFDRDPAKDAERDERDRLRYGGDRVVGREEWEERQSKDRALSGLRTLLSKSSRQLEKPKPFVPHVAGEAFEYEPGSRLAVWRSLSTRHKYILDQSATGTGKSFDSGNVTPDQFGAERLLYITDQVRNPTVSTLSNDNGWRGLEGRHGGLKLDDMGKLRVAKAGDLVDVPGNCARTSAISALRSKNVFGADTDAACVTCPLQKACKHFSGGGYGFKYQRRIALQNNKIRVHPASLPEPYDFDYSNTLAILDEPGQNLTTSKTVVVSLQDLEQLTSKLALENPELFVQVQPILSGLKALMGKKSRYGFTSQQIKAELPAPPDVNLEALSVALEPDLSVLESFDGTVAPDCDDRIEALRANYQRDRDDLDRQKAIELNNLLISRDDKAAIREKFKQRKQALKADFDADLKKLKASIQKEIKKADKLLRRFTSQTSDEAKQAIEQKVLKQWLPEFLGVLHGNSKDFAHVYNGSLTLTLAESRLPNILRAHKAVVFLDATLSRDDLALKIGCDPSEITVIKQRTEESRNCRIIQIYDLGRMGMQRGNEQRRRLDALIAHYRQLDPDGKVTDFKRNEADMAWWRDTRGVNDFETVKTLTLAGTPCQNINALLAEYAVLTGCADPEDKGFKAFVDRKIQADIQQAIGRLRAHRRPGEQLQVILITDFALGLPDVEQVKASEVTPEAAGKVERFKMAATRAIAKLKQAGEKITQNAVSLATGYSQQYVSRYWKLLLLLVESLNSKSSKKVSPPLDVGDQQNLDFSTSFLEQVTAELPPAELHESLQNVFFDAVAARHWPQLISNLTDRTRLILLESVLSVLPCEDLEAVAP